MGDHEPLRICAVINPRAGGWKRLPAVVDRRDLASLVAHWLAPDDPHAVRTMVMSGARDGAALTRIALADGFDTIVAVGGDGTVNDVIQALGAANHGARLGLIPMGTANVLARVLGLPIRDPDAAAKIVLEDTVRAIDLGYCGDQWFALVVGVGFDGAVTRAVNPELKQRLGRLAYVLGALRTVFRFPTCRVTVALDEQLPREFQSYLVLVANGGRYAGNYRLGGGVRVDDGLFDVYVCERKGPLALCILRHGWALWRGRLENAFGVTHEQARRVQVTADGPLQVQADGDPIGSTPTTVEIAPGRLHVLVSRTGSPPD